MVGNIKKCNFIILITFGKLFINYNKKFEKSKLVRLNLKTELPTSKTHNSFI